MENIYFDDVVTDDIEPVENSTEISNINGAILELKSLADRKAIVKAQIESLKSELNHVEAVESQVLTLIENNMLDSGVKKAIIEGYELGFRKTPETVQISNEGQLIKYFETSKFSDLMINTKVVKKIDKAMFKQWYKDGNRSEFAKVVPGKQKFYIKEIK